MLSWNKQIVNFDGPEYRMYATSHATEGDELCNDFQDMWLTLFKEQLPSYPKHKWDALLGTLVVWHGVFILEASLGQNLLSQLPGCFLRLEAIQKIWQKRSPWEGDAVVFELEQRVFTTLMLAFQRVASDSAVRAFLNERPLPIAILSDPDFPMIFESVLE